MHQIVRLPNRVSRYFLANASASQHTSPGLELENHLLLPMDSFSSYLCCING